MTKPAKPRVRPSAEQLARYPMADLDKPPVAIEENRPVDEPWITFEDGRSYTLAEIQAMRANRARIGPREGYCNCGARLGRSGKCPALCTPVEPPAPKYDGPAIIGGTHLGNMARADRGPGWIG